MPPTKPGEDRAPDPEAPTAPAPRDRASRSGRVLAIAPAPDLRTPERRAAFVRALLGGAAPDVENESRRETPESPPRPRDD